ncbi:MAG: nuclear transport factor 2 family protein [Pseudomonadota bacterium]
MEGKDPLAMPASTSGAESLILRLKDFYAAFSVENLGRLDDIYTQDLEFRDPIHHLRGVLAVRHYLHNMATNLKEYRIRYTDEQVGSNAAYLSWEMDFAHPALEGGKLLSLRGISHVKYTDKIYYHEDSYDVGALLYEHVPVVGFATRLIKNRMKR